MTKNEHFHFFVASRGVVSSKKAAAVDEAYHDVIDGINNKIIW